MGETDDGNFLERLRAYLVKAVREAKVHTEWLKPDQAYEEAFTHFAGALLAPAENNRYLSEFLPFAQKIALCGMYNSLAQTLVKLAAPGVADLYQGNELWDLSFVDPDNRRPVDFVVRRQWLDDLKRREMADRPRLLQDLLQALARRAHQALRILPVDQLSPRLSRAYDRRRVSAVAGLGRT